jgi:hypothetical protein
MGNGFEYGANMCGIDHDSLSPLSFGISDDYTPYNELSDLQRVIFLPLVVVILAKFIKKETVARPVSIIASVVAFLCLGQAYNFVLRFANDGAAYYEAMRGALPDAAWHIWVALALLAIELSSALFLYLVTRKKPLY